MVREDTKNEFYRAQAPSGFSGFQWANGARLGTGRSTLVPDGVLLSFVQSVV
jgi:hypothetical protein